MSLAIEPDELPRITRFLRHLGAAAPTEQTHESVYFDTRGSALHDGGISVCIRTRGSSHAQIVEHRNAPSVGLLDRDQWQTDVRGPRADRRAMGRLEVDPILRPPALGALRPAFQTRVTKIIHPLNWAESRVDATLSRIRVGAGSSRAVSARLDLEPHDGQLGGVFNLAKALDEISPVRLSIRSDADLGYELLNGSGVTPELAAPIHLSRTATVEEAFRTIGRSCLRQLLANEAPTLAGDGEGLHQMRVGVRRLRAAMSTFGDVVCDRHSQRIKKELRWIAAALGPARDLDVLMAELLVPLRERHAREPGVAALCRDFEARRKTAFAGAVAAVGSRRFRLLTLDALAWIEDGPWARSQDELLALRRGQGIVTLATDRIARRRRKLRTRGKTLQQLTVMQRHRLRISGKKLRYALEFFADLFSRKKQARRCKAALSALGRLQDSLGALSDIATREALAAHIVASRGSRSRTASAAERAFAAGVIFGTEDARIGQLLEQAEAARREFLAIKPFWK